MAAVPRGGVFETATATAMAHSEPVDASPGFTPACQLFERILPLFASTISSVKLHDKRKIRQTFTPVLPDELVISLGEQLTGTFLFATKPACSRGCCADTVLFQW